MNDTDDATSDASTANERAGDDAPPGDSVAVGLADHALPLGTTRPDADRGVFGPFDDAIADAEVVGLGEATHGTREFFELKHRLVRWLAAEHDLGAFVMEANLPEARTVDEYVVHGRGDPAAALADVYFWTWQVQAVRDLLAWLRAYNADRPLGDRVRVYGVDAQYARGAVAALSDQFETVAPEVLTDCRDDLAVVDAGGEPMHQDDDLGARVAAAERLLPRLREHLTERRGEHVATTDERAWEQACRDVTVLEQCTDLRRAWADRRRAADALDGDDSGDLPAQFVERTLRVRDRAMADNAAWVADRVDGPVALWAHDAHLNRLEQRSRHTGATATSLGGHLADRYGDGYYALGFAFGRGEFRALGPDGDGGSERRPVAVEAPLEGTVEAMLDRVAGDDGRLPAGPFALDLRTAGADDRLGEWLATPREHLSAGATFDPAAPTEYLRSYEYAAAFDGLCYVPETTASRPLPE
ncbi:MAG: erythromycin esterase family protein [Halolamina sp.]